jgi:ABC-type branched-subunit amino acid transport system substrate-binding protein
MRAAALVRPRAAWLGAAFAALALVLAGCSTATNSAVTVSGGTLTIYAGQPPSGSGGQAATDALDAEQLALRQTGSKVGKFTVKLVPLHGAEISANARAAVQDSSAIAYLGELVPGTSQVSVQITNELGLLEVSPADTAVYLTQPTSAVSGAPSTFYPSSSTYHETFARVVPNTAQEAKALVAEMQRLHLSKLYVASDGRPYGASVALEVRQDAPSKGLSLVPSAAGADAVFYGGEPGTAATTALDQAAAASPSAKLFAASALYDDAFVAGLSSAAQQNLYVSSPGFTSGALTPAGKQFVSAFTSTYGHAPAVQAIFSYEAMSALLAVLKQSGANAGNRAVVVNGFRTLKNRQSVLGPYSIVGGDTSIAPFVIARPAGGKLVPRTQG